ncbi:MAG: carbohydrate binding domain-containing protein [Clostridia bacterium]|nr:carbohydrate binding domain-containing protein [Clostridia bacterium]
MRKSIVVFLIAVLLFQSFSALAYIQNGGFETVSNYAPEGWILHGGASHVPKTWDASSQNLLTNGDFESVSGGVPSGWQYNRGSTYAFASSTVKQNGSYGLGIKYKDTIASQIISIEPETDYVLTASLYMDGGSEENVTVMVSYFAEDGTDCGIGDYLESLPTAGKWYTLQTAFRTSHKVSTAKISLYMTNNEGTCYFDDVSLFKTAEEYTFDTSEIFYYSDMENGEATVYGNALSGSEKVQFTLEYMEKALKTQTVSFSGGKATFPFSLSLLQNLKKEYTVTARVLKGTTEEKVFSQAIYKYPRPSALGKDGVYRINGEPFYPVIGYHVDDGHHTRLKEIGVNVVQVSSSWLSEDLLDSYLEHNVKALVCLYSGGGAFMEPGGHPDNYDNTIEIVEKYKDHPAIFAWSSMDEPFVLGNNNKRAEWLFDNYKIVRDRDDVHPVYICQAPAQYYTLAEKYCDILACDPYPFSDDSAKVTTQTEMCVRAAKCGKPVYTIVQSYGSSDARSTDYIRQQVYRGFESGAKGIGYYSISDAITNPRGPLWNRADTWEGLGNFAKEELPLLFEMYTGNNGSVLADSKNAAEVHSSYYKIKTVADGKQAYFVLHNRSNTGKNISVPLPVTGSFKIREAGAETDTNTASPLSNYMNAQVAKLFVLTFEQPALLAALQSVSEEKTYHESSSVSLLAESTGENKYISLPFKGALASQRISGLSPISSYQLTLSYKSSVKNALKAHVSFFVHDENGFTRWADYCKANTLEYVDAEKSYSETFGTAEEAGGQWRSITFTFNMPRYANALYLEFSAVEKDVYAAVDNVSLTKCSQLNLLKNGSLDYLNGELLCGGWFSYNEYMKAYGNATLKDGYIEMREHTVQNASANLRQTVCLYEGETYVLSFDFKGEQPDISIMYTGLATNSVKSWGRTAPDWETYTVYFTAKQTGKYTMMFGDRTTKGTYAYDNIILAPFVSEKGAIGIENDTLSGTGCVDYLFVPMEEAVEGNMIVLVPNAEGSTLLCSLYNAKNELQGIFMKETTGVYAKNRFCRQKNTTLVKAFLWNKNLSPKGKATIWTLK